MITRAVATMGSTGGGTSVSVRTRPTVVNSGITLRVVTTSMSRARVPAVAVRVGQSKSRG